VDPRDTSILTRLGNLLVKEHKQVEAVDVYKKVLALEDTLSNVWFNLANAQLSIGDEEGTDSCRSNDGMCFLFQVQGPSSMGASVPVPGRPHIKQF
jgi:hypothetical protein